MRDDNFGSALHRRALRRSADRDCDHLALLRSANGEGLCRRGCARSLFFAGLECHLSARAIAVARVDVTLPKVKAGDFSDALEVEERDQLLVEDCIPSI